MLYPTGKDIKDVLSHFVVGNESLGEDYELQYEVYIHRDFYDYLQYMRDHLDDLEARRFEALDMEGIARFSTLARRFSQISEKVCAVRKLCLSKRQYLGWTAQFTEVGDVICIFYGAGVPCHLAARWR
jgi:hypothetical protein